MLQLLLKRPRTSSPLYICIYVRIHVHVCMDWLKEKIKPTSRNMIQRYKYELHRCIQKPDQTFTQFFGILKSKVELAKAF